MSMLTAILIIGLVILYILSRIELYITKNNKQIEIVPNGSYIEIKDGEIVKIKRR